MDNNKVDKGFELSYFNLSYRRKFIRTLWLAPFAVLFLVLIWFASPNSIIINAVLTFLIVSLNIIQGFYTYTKWKIESSKK